MKATGIAAAAAGMVLGAAAAVRFGTFLWSRTTARAIAALQTQQLHDHGPATYVLGQGEELPEPVARYFRFALGPRGPLIRAARLEQTGTMRSALDKPWMPFRAVEHFAARSPGFVWDASMQIGPLVSIHVRDSYVGGEGASEVKIAGLVPVGNLRGTPEAASASLVRYLAESAWLPTALLPSNHLRWSPIDDRTARATLTDATTTVSIDVHFGAQGEIASLSTLRGREFEGAVVVTPWGGRYAKYTSIQGMMIPLTAEVEWTLADGPVAYWRGEIAVAEYEFTM